MITAFVALLVFVGVVYAKHHHKTAQQRRRDEFRKDMRGVATLRRINAVTPHKERDT